jgi:hypothetical protein
MAMAAGMSMGYAMQPHLDAVDRPEGPQMFTTVSVDHPTGPFDDIQATYANYHGRLPDYVIGTDWKRATATYVPERAVVSTEAGFARADTAAEEPVIPSAEPYEEPPAVQPSYPSIDGGSSLPPHAKDAASAVSDEDSAPVIIG